MREGRHHLGRVTISPKLAQYVILCQEYFHNRKEKQLAFRQFKYNRKKESFKGY